MVRRLSMRKLALLLGLTGVLALAFAVVARAVPPQHFPVEHVDESFIIEDECEFPVVLRVEGDLQQTLFFDRHGNVTRVLTVFPNYRVTLTNLETGKSITSPAPAVEHLNINPDGSAVITVTGLQGHLILSGGPPQAADVGRLVLFVSGPEDEDSDVVFQAGKFNFGPFPQICDVLADP
jgi:hypothetical protein